MAAVRDPRGEKRASSKGAPASKGRAAPQSAKKSPQPQGKPSQGKALKPRSPQKRALPERPPQKPALPKLPRDPKLVALAEVARPHGIAGELRLKVYNPDSDLLRHRPPVLLRLPDGTTRDAAITTARDADKALLVRFAGVDDRDAAEGLRGAEVCVPRTALPPPGEGEFYAWDIEGAEAVLTSGEPVGEVLELVSYPTCDVLVVSRPGGKKIEVPLTAAYVARVDVGGAGRRLVEIVTLEGLD